MVQQNRRERDKLKSEIMKNRDGVDAKSRFSKRPLIAKGCGDVQSGRTIME